MSDYAGPILGTVGAIVGFVGTGGNPAGAYWGWTIGSTLGGMYSASQQVIPGPKIGDIVRQTSQEGGFRPIVYGRSHPIAGNVIADSEPKIVTKRESQGKGGPKVESESAYRTYAVGFCEGEAKLLQAWRNGILVFNAEDPSMAAENAKFLEYATWYTGSFDQPASQDLEEIYGAGQAPFFRGTSYLSLHNEDVTDQRGAWSQWQVRVFRGAAKSYTTPPYPVMVLDELGVGSVARDGRYISIYTDELSVMSFALSGTHRDLIRIYGYGPEEINVASVALNGVHKALMVSYAVPPEELNITSLSLNGTHKLIRIYYLNYPPEELNITSHSLNGTHAPV